GLADVLRSALKTVVSSALMGLAVWFASHGLMPPGSGFVAHLLGISACVALGVASFLLFSYILKSRELGDLFVGIWRPARENIDGK
ncbi:MAG: murein biosynthesis integral membrane protein MurJ, partial [Deltaproteobacteria bacterium]